MYKFWLACLFFFCSTANALAVSISVTNAPTTVATEEFTLTVKVEGAASGTNYLRVDLYQDGSSKYFGETDNGTFWYGGSDGKSYAPIVIASSSAELQVRARLGEPTVSDYPGPGKYKLRIRRYTNSGNQSSNDIQTPIDIDITKTWPTPTPTPTPTPSPSPSPSPTSTATPAPTPTPTPTPKPASPSGGPSLKPSPSPTPEITATPAEGSVAGTATEINLSGFGFSPPASPESQGKGGSPTKPTLNKSRAKTVIAIGSGLLILSIASFFGYRKYLSVYNHKV